MRNKTYTTVELRRALQKGYKIKIHAAIKYERLRGLMQKYVANFLKMKIETSGKISKKEAAEINDYHEACGFEFKVSAEDCVDNPGLRKIAKLCLNSLWGKFGQRPDLESYQHITDYGVLLDRFIHSPSVRPKTWYIVHDRCVELRYVEDPEMSTEPCYISEITAAFTTANARMRLYDMLDWLDPSQLIYCDTDSAFFLVDETNPKHKQPKNDWPDLPPSIRFGNGLGEWSNELGKGEHIEEIVCAGAKSYAYRTNLGKLVVKQKGITLDMANNQRINLDTMIRMALNHDPDKPRICGPERKPKSLRSTAKHQFKWDNITKDIVTVYISRSIRNTVYEKRRIEGYDTKPLK
jgi:hypothetical protein